MPYIIENALIISEKNKQKVSLFIRGGDIRYQNKQVSKVLRTHLNDYQFLLTPSFVFFSSDLPTLPFGEFKQYFSKFITQGFGTIITDFSVNHQFEFADKLQRKRLALLNSPLDYLLGIRVPISKFTPSLIRTCTKEKIPFILIEFNASKELERIPWGWIKEATFPYNPVLIPFFPLQMKRFVQHRLLQKWKEIMQREKISHLPAPLPMNKPLNLTILKKLGLYPKKGILDPNGEISYNLFLRKERFDLPFQLTSHPSIVVFKGKLIAIDQNPIFRPGFGEELVIKKTALFV